MASNSDKQINVDPMRIAWLLRADLRKGKSANSPISDWFKVWWLIHGSREYPAWANQGRSSDIKIFRPQEGMPNYCGFGICPALDFLLDTDAALLDKFDVSTDVGLLDAIAWLFVHGVRELKLASALDDDTLAALDASPPFFAADELVTDDAPALTWLMFFAWRISSDLRNSYDLKNPEARNAYLSWFLLNGVPQLALAPLLAPRWKDWLRQPVLKNHARKAVPRAAYLLWQRHQQLQAAFDLQTDHGIAALAMWSAEIWSTQAELSWINHIEVPPARLTLPSKNRPFGVNLIGFAFGELGIGEDVRMAVAASEAAGIPFAVVNIHPGNGLRQADQALAAHVAETAEQEDIAPYAYNIFCLTAFDTARLFLERGELFNGRFNIGWWPWELPVWPSDWRLVFDLVDEVWAASNFTYRMYTEAIALKPAPRIPVMLMPMAASVERVKLMPRDTLGLPEHPYLFLYVFDFNSYVARKNPFAAVQAFQEAFRKDDDSVGLVLKTMNANPNNPEWINFRDTCSRDPRIFFIERTMERGEVLGLIQACDGYISLHRAEGFGRTLAEAMLFGRAVVSTDFSGNADFVRDGTGYPVKWSKTPVNLGEYPFIAPEDSAWWAQPSIESAAEQMRQSRVRSSMEYTRELDNQNVMKIAQEIFSPSSIGGKMLAQLQRIALKKIKE